MLTAVEWAGYRVSRFGSVPTLFALVRITPILSDPIRAAAGIEAEFRAAIEGEATELLTVNLLQESLISLWKWPIHGTRV